MERNKIWSCLPLLHAWCKCGANGKPKHGNYGLYIQNTPHIQDSVDTLDYIYGIDRLFYFSDQTVARSNRAGGA